MCGRFEIHSAIEIIARLFQIDDILFMPGQSYNIAPGQSVPMVGMHEGKLRLEEARWGFVPRWAKDPKTGYRMINARSETVATSTAFREAFARHRCLVIADGFYEWKGTAKSKQPYLIRLRSGEPMAFAGLYSDWSPPDGEPVRTCTIITTAANEAVAALHDRMPAILGPTEIRSWIDPEKKSRDELLSLLRPCPDDILDIFPVTPKMNSATYNDPENIRPLGSALTGS